MPPPTELNPSQIRDGRRRLAKREEGAKKVDWEWV